MHCQLITRSGDRLDPVGLQCTVYGQRMDCKLCAFDVHSTQDRWRPVHSCCTDCTTRCRRRTSFRWLWLHAACLHDMESKAKIHSAGGGCREGSCCLLSYRSPQLTKPSANTPAANEWLEPHSCKYKRTWRMCCVTEVITWRIGHCCRFSKVICNFTWTPQLTVLNLAQQQHQHDIAAVCRVTTYTLLQAALLTVL